ncbi:MAG: AmmeMemoRadiSam system protein B [Elusimicrobia bacterium RIFOXYB2_FULL_50_12]|nr:MAG: AmmeMemoRadiSam system protein B [Elusimicrobia bacterium RIFOXYB2_FULL_50_12]
MVSKAAAIIYSIVLFLVSIFGHSIATNTKNINYSFYTNAPENYLDAIETYRRNYKSAKSSHKANYIAGIVTHHFLARSLMVELFESIQNEKIGHIILIGPDHFQKGASPISISSLNWQTSFGILKTNKRVARNIMKVLSLTEDSSAFYGEHSIGVLVPLIKFYFPEAKVTTIMISSKAAPPQLYLLKDALIEETRKPNTFILLSSDFSHGANLVTTISRDAESRNILSTMDIAKIMSMNIDCRKGLWLVMNILKEIDRTNIVFLNHSTSDDFSPTKTGRNLTSYYSVLFN